VRRAIARGGDGIGVCRAGDAGKVQLAGKESAGEIGIEGGEIEHQFPGRANLRIELIAEIKVRALKGSACSWLPWPGSAAMVMEMSAARAEWVSAPTLMKSTPVSA
jgi:hypothetical protein